MQSLVELSVDNHEEDGDDPPIGSSARRYRWLGEVNRGGMGIIHGARDPVIGRRVAIKVLRGDETVTLRATLVDRDDWIRDQSPR